MPALVEIAARIDSARTRGYNDLLKFIQLF